MSACSTAKRRRKQYKKGYLHIPKKGRPRYRKTAPEGKVKSK